MLTVGLEVEPRSITDVMPTALEHFGVAAPAYARSLVGRMTTRSELVESPAPAGSAGRAGARGDRQGSARAVRSGGAPQPGLRRRRAPDRPRRHDLAAVMVAAICALLRAARRRARARRRHGLGVPGGGAGRAGGRRRRRSSACPSSPSRRALPSPRPATEPSRCGSATGRSESPSGRRTTAIAVAAAAPRRRPRCLHSSRPEGGSSFRSAVAAASGSR